MMRALVMNSYKLFTIEDYPIPEYGPDDVLIRIKACAICGSDVHGMDGSTGRRIPPIIMGHEAAGLIEQVGTDVRDYQPGDRVTFDSTIYCGDCYFCRRGEVNLCRNRRVVGVSCADYRKHGAFAEYMAVPRRILYRLPAKITYAQAAMTEPLAIAYHAVKRSPVSLGDTAVVVGSGMIGLLVIQLLKLAGCSRIIAVDLVSKKLELAAKFGADTLLKADEVDVAAAVRKMTDDRGADIAFEVVGINAALQTAVACLKNGGSLTMVGNLQPTVDFPLQAVVTRQLSLYGSCCSAGEYPACLDLIAAGKVDVDTFISAVAPLDAGPDWFRRLYAQEKGLMKVILTP